MIRCPTCQQDLEDGVRFCPHDGTPLIETTRADVTPTGDRRSTARELELPVLIGGRYRLEQLRGGGGMAKVYRAVDQHLDRVVAVKLINPELRNEPEFDARFQREARIVSQLNDPHIVVVHDFGLDPVLGPYLVMEYLQGQSLRERLVNEGRLPLKAALQLAGQLLLALVHAHNKGIVHRDIKPDNIFLLNQSGVRLHVRVLDFGIARIYAGDDSRQETITHAGSVLGTPRYMSPEQLAGKSVDARSDLYSAALVLFESLTGELPYTQGKKLMDLCPDAPLSLQALIEQCLKPEVSERPPSAVEVYLRLQELGKASGILLLPPGSMDKILAARKANDPTVLYQPDEAPVRSRRHFLIGGLSALLLLLLVLIGWWSLTSSAEVAGPEGLHDIHVGDEQQLVEERQLLIRADHGDPWQLPAIRKLLSPALKPDLLGLHPNERENLDIRRTADDRLLVLLSKEKVLAVQSRRSDAVTNRSVRLRTDIGQVARDYGDVRADLSTAELPEGKTVEIRVYPERGLAIEAQEGRVSALVLFPPRP